MPKKTRAIKHSDRKKAWARRKTSSKPYVLESKEPAKLFLIICEGENTEPSYFKSFPLGNATVESYGLGSSKTALVKQILQLLESEADAKQKEVWVVFDFDIHPEQIAKQKEDYNNAIALAEKNGLKMAYSNDSFELWFLLHYQPLDTPWTRFNYYQKLGELWNCNYEKEGKKIEFCRAIYRHLTEDTTANQGEAIVRAKKLYEEHKSNNPADKNPCTTVYQLVQELNKYL